MKWKIALTAEQAALQITGLLENYSSLVEIDKILEPDNEPYPDSKHWQGWQDLKSDFNEAVDLASTLWDEITHAWRRQECGEGRGSILVLDSWYYSDECCDSLSKKGCKVTRESLAAWAYEMDGLDTAKMIYPNFDPKNIATSTETDFVLQNDFLNGSSRSKDSLKNTDSTIGSKSRNSYLRTIQVLADALLSNGLTNNDSGDARLILNKLAQKGKEAPLKERALANYLKEARELP